MFVFQELYEVNLKWGYSRCKDEHELPKIII